MRVAYVDLVVLLLASAAVLAGCDSHNRANQQSATEPSPAEMAVSAQPLAEKTFLNTIEQGRTTYRSASNDLGKGAARSNRRDKLCSTFEGLTVRDWTGTIAKLSTNSEGKGVVEIRVADDVVLATWNNALSDVIDGTLIDTSSALFHKLSAMQVGQAVKFSGQFHPSDTDCFEEQSLLSLEGSVLRPHFVMIFTDASPLASAKIAEDNKSSPPSPVALPPILKQEAVPASSTPDELVAALPKVLPPASVRPLARSAPIQPVQGPPQPQAAPEAQVVDNPTYAEPNTRCSAEALLGRQAFIERQAGASPPQTLRDLLGRGSFAKVLTQQDVEAIVQQAYRFSGYDAGDFAHLAEQNCLARRP